MSLIFETFYTDGLAQVSYLVGDDDDGVAAVFDPRADVEIYQEMARKKGVSISHIFETHIHADLVSGSRELQARVPTARIYVSHEADATYGFATDGVRDGDQFYFGSLIVTARHTPGHTPEHISYLLADASEPALPWGVLSGDSLFVSSAGRPDLLGEKATAKLARQQFHTLYDFFLKLPDLVIVYPGHASGSPCGADIGDRLSSTIGYERKTNAFLQFDTPEKFIDFAVSTTPPIPRYYPHLKKVNAEGPPIAGGLPYITALSLPRFRQVLEGGGVELIDTRSMFAFGGGHIAGALNIGGSPTLSIWSGSLMDPEKPILLVAENDSEIEQLLRRFLRTGFTKFAGYLLDGMKSWIAAGLPVATINQMGVEELNAASDKLQIVDVRSPREWRGGHVPGAKHIVLPELEKRSSELDRKRPIAVYCQSGYRASIGSSILQRAGFDSVNNVPGSWAAWKASGLPISKNGQ